MLKQIIFIITVVIALGIFAFTIYRLWFNFKLTKPYPIKNWGKRFVNLMKVGFFQTKIFRWPWIGLAHAIVFWGFCIIIFDSIEMIFDGILGTDHCMIFWGWLYKFITVSGDIFALLVAIGILIFMFRRLFLKIRRFTGIEMQHKSHMDANIALLLILLLMLTILGKNAFYILSVPGAHTNLFPVSRNISALFAGISPNTAFILYQVNWWIHILLVFVFANVLPYSKHFHVFMSLPNVFLSRLEPLGKLPNLDSVMNEVRIMMDPCYAYDANMSDAPKRFGVLDADDVNWKNYLDSLTCTECGRCTSVCPANITGKKLSPRKIYIDLRARMKEKGRGLMKNGKDFDDKKTFIRDYISEEELWACTTCNACAQECPVNINHPSLIVDMRRYLVMEEGKAPTGLNAIFANIENNGAPWQFSPEDRMNWVK